MGEALDAVKKNLGLEVNPAAKKEGDKPDPLAELEAAIAKVENIEARELLQIKAREIRANMELRAAQAEEKVKELSHRGGAGGEQVNERAKVKQEIVANSLVLLEKGVDPSVVAQYIMGSGAPQVPINLGGGGQQGITITDVMSLMDHMDKSRGGSSELDRILERLTSKVEAIENRGGNNKAEPATHYLIQDGEVKEFHGNAPIVIQPRPAASTVGGDPLDVVQEKNRHEEKMEDIRGTKEYHNKITEIAGDAFENIGRGLASQVMEDAEAGNGGEGAKLEYFVCPEEDCGTRIPVTSETQQITCPKCHGIYSRKPEASEEK